jgi:sulfonate transport system permease protein
MIRRSTDLTTLLSRDDLQMSSGLLLGQSDDQLINRHLASALPASVETVSWPQSLAATPSSRDNLSSGIDARPLPATQRRSSTRRSAQAKLPSTALGLSLPLALLIAWQLSSLYGWLPDQILPAPSVVVQTLHDGIADGSLWSDTAISLLRVLRGVAVGGAIGLALGGAMALSRRLHDYLNPVFLAVSQVPILGWVPLMILLVGIDEGLKTILVALSVFIPVTLGTYQGIRDVPPAYREVGRVFTFNRRQTLTTIILPAAVPAIFTGLREGLSNGWQTLVAVELLASTEGLGYQMAYGRQLFQLEVVIAAMLVIGLIGYGSDAVLGRIETHLQRWKVSQ